MTLQSAAEQVEELRRAIARSRAAVADGLIVDLTGLDAEVARVTGIARNVPSSERRRVLAAMEGLLEELDGLTVDLRRQRDAAATCRAADAYRTETEVG